MLKSLIKIFIFFLTKFIPKKKILVFGDRAGRRFADNSRYLYLYLSEFKKDYECVWITSDIKIKNYLNQKKYICCTPFSLKGIYYILSAKYNLYNFVEGDINKFLTEFSDSIHLWHGVLPKKLKEIKTKETKLNNFFYSKLNKYFFYPNEKMSKNIFNRFPKNKYQLKVFNLPRTIIFDKRFSNENMFRTDQEIKFREKILKKKKIVYGYFPTWRQDGLELFRDVNDLNKLEEINNLLGETNALMIIKKHMNSDKKDKNILYNKKIEKLISHLENKENFIFADYDFDLNSILDICDVLISDYSGVIFDYLYLDRPIIIYAPDYDEFKRNTGFVLDPTEHNFSFKAKNFDELNKLIMNFFSNPEEFKNFHTKSRSSVKNKVFKREFDLNEIIKFIDE